MNADIKSKWVEALRSGDYMQGQDYLLDIEGLEGNRYCCLGVLCDLYAQAHELEFSESTRERFKDCNPDGSSMELPSLKVIEWAGLTAHDPMVEYSKDDEDDEGKWSLSHINDSGHTFKQIADVIEAQL